nr:venom allergen 5-like isoform X1 [Procambarus clarkii]
MAHGTFARLLFVFLLKGVEPNPANDGEVLDQVLPATQFLAPLTSAKDDPVPGSSFTSGGRQARSCDYSQFAEDHTMTLQPNLACLVSRTGVTADEQVQILTAHNNFRAKVARGEEVLGDAGPQPSGANIREVVWNDELAQVAQAWASQCPTGHDTYNQRRICSRSYFVGQNIYFQWSTNPASVWEKAVQAWYNEVQYMPNTNVAAFSSRVPSGKAIGHYTQVVWGTTYEIGCGAVYYTDTRWGYTFTQSKTYVCNYGPAGNFLGSPVYEAGVAASLCPGTPSLNYTGLCN